MSDGMKRALTLPAILTPALIGLKALEWSTGADVTFCAGLVTGLVLGQAKGPSA